MPIAFTCPNCGLKGQAADEFAGQTGPCARCGQPLSIPTLEEIESANVSPQRSLSGVLVSLAAVGGVALVIGGALFFIFRPVILSAREAARRTDCVANLQQIYQALKQYEAEHGSLPPAYTTDAEGSRLHSWRTLILPYLDQQALYDQIDLDEPWDDEKNRLAVTTSVAAFTCPSDDDAPAERTNYVVLVGKGAIFGPQSVSLKAVEDNDGAAGTLLVVEVVDANIHWMAPRDIDIGDLDEAYKTVGGKSVSSHHGDRVYALFADGSVRSIATSVRPGVLKRIATYKGGEPAYIGEDYGFGPPLKAE